MTTYRRNIALVVEGMGSDPTKSAGIAWHYGRASIGTPGDYEWVGGTGTGTGLISPPESVACSVDPLECQLRGNAHQFRMHATALAKSLWQGRAVTPVDTLDTALTEAATQVVLSAAGTAWASSDDGSVIWIGDEAIQLGTHTTGGTFTGCSRGHYSTTAQAQPAGMNVYTRNPKRINRLARMLVYDRDAGTTTQAWQGFVTKYSVDNGVLMVDCQDVWSMVVGAQINRRAHNKRSAVSGAPSPGVARGRGLTYKESSAAFAGKRVNKLDAVAPHWVSYQFSGGLVHGKWEAVAGERYITGKAPLIDVDGTYDSGSAGRLGSEVIIPDDDEPRRSYELLVVDRLRDANATYANMRSSTRDLDQPFHPVAISMAILTSGYSTVPGVIDATPTEFGTTPTLTVTEVQIYADGAVLCEGIRDEGETGWICGTSHAVTSVDSFPLRLAPDGTVAWMFEPSTGYALCQAGSLKYDLATNRAWFGGARSGGTPFRSIACCNLDDGVSVFNGGMSFSSDPVFTYDPDADAILAMRSGSSLSYLVNPATGAQIDTWQPQPVGTFRSATAYSGGVSLFTDSTAAAFIAFDHPAADNDNRIWAVNAAALGLGSLQLVQTINIIAPDGLSTGFWVSTGSSTRQTKIFHLDLAGNVDAEIDTDGDWLGSSSSPTLSVATDRYGDVYVGKHAAADGSYEVARYKPDGTLVWVVEDIFPTVTSGSVQDLGVDGAGNVLACSAEGVGSIISQA